MPQPAAGPTGVGFVNPHPHPNAQTSIDSAIQRATAAAGAATSGGGDAVPELGELVTALEAVLGQLGASGAGSTSAVSGAATSQQASMLQQT